MSHNETQITSTADTLKPEIDGRLRPMLVASAVCGLFVGATVSAAEYHVQPSISSRITMNDNLLLSPDDREIETFLLELTPRLRVSRTTEKWQAAVDVSVTAERLEDDDFDSDNQVISLQLTRQAETVQFQFVALNDRGNTRATELDDLGEIGFDVDRRDRQYVRPSITWTLNPKNRLAFGLSAENLHYDGFIFSDYDYYAADIGWTHQFDEKTRFELSTFGSEYISVPPIFGAGRFDFCESDIFFLPNFPGPGRTEEFSSETIGVQIGGSRQPTSRLNYRGSIGYRDVKNTSSTRCFEQGRFSSDTDDITGSSDGFILDTGMTYQGEKYGLDLSLSRSISPVGLGFLTERDNFRFSVSYRYTEHITGTFLVSGFNTESIDDGFEFEREGFRVSPGVTWRFNEKLNLNGGVVYRSAESLNVEGKRDGLSAYVGFNYNFKPKRFNR